MFFFLRLEMRAAVLFGASLVVASEAFVASGLVPRLDCRACVPLRGTPSLLTLKAVGKRPDAAMLQVYCLASYFVTSILILIYPCVRKRVDCPPWGGTRASDATA